MAAYAFTVALKDLSDPLAVRAAAAEYDELGQDAFLEKYGFGRAREFILVIDGKQYDSKAIVGAAHGIQHPDLGPLGLHDFSGGEKHAAPVLRSLGFEVVRLEQKRQSNPDWTREELILALDLYLQEGHALNKTDPRVQELSEVLNQLPIHEERLDGGTFRNANGVGMKLANFSRLDPNYSGKGMEKGNKLDIEVWDQFHDMPDEVHRLAQQLRDGVALHDLPAIPEPDEEEVVADEGALFYRMHRRRERDRDLVRKKKAKVLSETGTLACEVCGFDFRDVYGDLGDGFIECHHKLPLSEAGTTKNRLSDLAVLCSNCHRMIHRARPALAVEDLRERVLRLRS